MPEIMKIGRQWTKWLQK